MISMEDLGQFLHTYCGHDLFNSFGSPSEIMSFIQHGSCKGVLDLGFVTLLGAIITSPFHLQHKVKCEWFVLFGNVQFMEMEVSDLVDALGK